MSERFIKGLCSKNDGIGKYNRINYVWNYVQQEERVQKVQCVCVCVLC